MTVDHSGPEVMEGVGSIFAKGENPHRETDRPVVADDDLDAAFRRFEKRVATNDDVIVGFVVVPLVAVVLAFGAVALWAAIQ